MTMRIEGLAKILLDLDRCQHGRHEGDACFGCPTGFSSGNPNMTTGQVIGYGLDGQWIVLPDREHKHDPNAWRVAR